MKTIKMHIDVLKLINKDREIKGLPAVVGILVNDDLDPVKQIVEVRIDDGSVYG